MSSDYLRGHVITPLDFSTHDRLLAQIDAKLVEQNHKIDVLTEMVSTQAEFIRQLALAYKGVDIQLGILRERLPKADG